mmetsp:Transcript_6066/g.14100  ORF Transcript_6066/g.14100 Transcript_6066/m.14100 type:complete len:107 (+) Transcript_6066:924-1244(+)
MTLLTKMRRRGGAMQMATRKRTNQFGCALGAKAPSSLELLLCLRQGQSNERVQVDHLTAGVPSPKPHSTIDDSRGNTASAEDDASAILLPSDLVFRTGRRRIGRDW